MTDSDKVTRDDRFIEWLESVRDSDDPGARGTLAALRRGLGQRPGTAMEMYPYIVPFLTEKDSYWTEQCIFTIASLFAMHPQPGGEGSMGSVMSKVAKKSESDSVERRFVALLDSTRDELPGRLRHAVSLARSKDVPIDWSQLLKDMKGWNEYELWVQRKWARDYWSKRTVASEDEEFDDTVEEEVTTSEG